MAAHVNLTTDTVVANLSPDGLRSVLRSLLVSCPGFTDAFQTQSKNYLSKTMQRSIPQLFVINTEAPAVPTTGLALLQGRIRAMQGCGLGFQSLDLLRSIVEQALPLKVDEETEAGEHLMDVLAAVDGDLVQAVTSSLKELDHDSRNMTTEEFTLVKKLWLILSEAQQRAEASGTEFMFERGLSIIEDAVDDAKTALKIS